MTAIMPACTAIRYRYYGRQHRYRLPYGFIGFQIVSNQYFQTSLQDMLLQSKDAYPRFFVQR